ncbi:MAG: hypothetical protein JWR85_1829 [Marmoricola sp.]|nr:hypothetical protein [Marmoricola sp.]
MLTDQSERADPAAGHDGLTVAAVALKPLDAVRLNRPANSYWASQVEERQVQLMQ